MKYVIGVDFGTLSCRAVLVSEEGKLVRTSVKEYAHGCIERPDNGVLQDPQNYLYCLQATVRQVAEGYVQDIVSVGIDFTACTVLPVNEKLEPLAHAKLWKSHSAAKQADRVQALCLQLGMDLGDYGGSVSSEWLIPKLLELKEEQPEVYAAAAYYLEAGDWLVWRLTGKKVRSACLAGFKGQWQGGWPSALLEALGLDERLLAGTVLPAGAFAGSLTAESAAFLGLRPETAVVTAVIDAHSALPAAGVCREGDMMLILGTSGCDLLLSKTDATVPGIFGKVMDGVLPGYYVYEAGQACLGDLFGWFMENCVPHSYYEASGGKVFSYLEQLASQVQDDRVWALDWWNGSRSPYADPRLTGCLFGLSLQTRPEHIYRALLEAAAFGTRQIFDMLETRGVTISRVVAGGGIPQKNALFMQILSDVLGREIYINENEPASAMGAAVLAAWGGGLYASVEEAISAMAGTPTACYRPDPKADYTAKYRRYTENADRMARG